ncbi:hypothetical protein B2G71_01810 [Novosphingobium sp. PC22D]|nr:hypothetical protein B2G71_01810 [Novosphingobium sp. PC22D]
MVPMTGRDPIEMGMDGAEPELIRRLSASPCYRALFDAAFPGRSDSPIGFATVSRALAAFERTIVSYDSAWDRAHAGEAPLSAAAARGEALFAGGAGCASCHAGRDFTDRAFHRLPGWSADAEDQGLARETGRAADAGLFRTPPLRNVAATAPYLHDGSAATFDEVLAYHGAALAPPDRRAIAAFLASLSDTSLDDDPRFALPDPECPVP